MTDRQELTSNIKKNIMEKYNLTHLHICDDTYDGLYWSVYYRYKNGELLTRKFQTKEPINFSTAFKILIPTFDKEFLTCRN